MDDTILETVKRMLGIANETTEFDIDIRTNINATFFALHQIGVGPDTPFNIDEDTMWDEFDTQVPKSMVLDYLYLKTKLIFDPPQSSNVMEAYKDRLSELEFRMSVTVDNGNGVITG